jgi:hypothetical protein
MPHHQQILAYRVDEVWALCPKSCHAALSGVQLIFSEMLCSSLLKCYAFPSSLVYDVAHMPHYRQIAACGSTIGLHHCDK